MGDKIKPWHAKKPKRYGKKVSPLRVDPGRRIIPLQVDTSRVSPLRVDDFDPEEYDEDERWRR